MSPFETFLACICVCTFAVALLATWFRYLPTLIALYRITMYHWNQPTPKKYTEDNLNFYALDYVYKKKLSI